MGKKDLRFFPVVILFLVWVFLPAVDSSAETISLTTGQVFECQIVEMNNDSLTFDLNGITITSGWGDVKEIRDNDGNLISLPAGQSEYLFSAKDNDDLTVGLDYYNLQQYEQALEYLLRVYQTAALNQNEVLDVFRTINHALVDSYNEIGQKHYFSKDVCLRIIYHNEKLFEVWPRSEPIGSYIEFLRKSLGHFDVASMGENVRMMEAGGDGADFDLPDDAISMEEKLRYKDKARERVKAYDAGNEDVVIESDKTIEDIMSLLDRGSAAIKSIHFKKIDKESSSEIVVAEILYAAPDRFKVKEKDRVTILTQGRVYLLDTANGKSLSEFAAEPDSLENNKFNDLQLTNFRWLKPYYDFEIRKVVTVPESLVKLSELDPALDLYRVSGVLKDKDICPFSPPVPKFEKFIDINKGIIVCDRQYWIGVIGSGKEIELAKESVVDEIQCFDSGVCLPYSVVTKGLIPELESLNKSWQIEVISLNEYIEDSEFQPNKYAN